MEILNIQKRWKIWRGGQKQIFQINTCWLLLLFVYVLSAYTLECFFLLTCTLFGKADVSTIHFQSSFSIYLTWFAFMRFALLISCFTHWDGIYDLNTHLTKGAVLNHSAFIYFQEQHWLDVLVVCLKCFELYYSCVKLSCCKWNYESKSLI